MNLASLRAWASAHPVAAQWLITFLFINLGIATFLLGLFVLGPDAHAHPALLTTGLSLGAILLGTSLWWRRRAPSRLAWKAYHVGMALVMALLGMYLGARFPVKYAPPAPIASVQVEARASLAVPVAQAPAAVKEAPQKARWWHRMIRKANTFRKELHPAWKVLLTILTILVVIGLGYIVAALACVLACGEMGAAAVALLILGWAGLIVGGVFTTIRIWRGKRRESRSENRA